METFVIRLWTPSVNEPAAGDDRVAGFAVHPRSGGECTFNGEETLLRFLRAHLAPTEARHRWDAHESEDSDGSR